MHGRAIEKHSCVGTQIRSQFLYLLTECPGAHERYKSLRSSFYADVSGVIIVVDSALRRRDPSTSVPGGTFLLAWKGSQSAALFCPN
jgi:hypothetical protein